MAHGTFGERLKRERELREVSVDEVTTATRIGPRFLEALENEQWEKLPGGIFNRGFVRAIARYLGLDEEGLLAEYDLAHAQTGSAPEPRKKEQRIPSPPIWKPIAGALVLLLLVAAVVTGGIYSWRRWRARRAIQHASLSAAPPSLHAETAGHALNTGPASLPAPTPVATAATRPTAAPLRLTIAASAATRVHIVGDGKLLLDAELHRGETREFTANNNFQVTAGDSSAVLLELNGTTMPPLGEPGAPGTMELSSKDLGQAPGGITQP
jgi:cytoskeletal protein RodZ